MEEIKYKDLNIIIKYDIEDSKEHIQDDYSILMTKGIDNILLEQFIPWLKGNEYENLDNLKILEGLNLYEITYDYHKIIEKYSPTGKEEYFGVFEFYFESGNEYTKNLLEAVAMKIYVCNKKIVKVTGYDI